MRGSTASSSEILLYPTDIRNYLKCPRMYLYGKSGIPALPHPHEKALEFGRLVHAIIRRYYDIIPRGISPREVQLYISKAAREAVGGMYDKLEWHLKGFVEFEMDRLSWHVNPKPVAVEREYVRPPLAGIVDAVFRKGDAVIVVDWKTGYGKNPRIDRDMAIQGCVYRRLTNASEVYFIFLRFGVVQRLPDYDREWLDSVVGRVLEGIRDGRFDRVKGEHCLECQYSLYCTFEEEGKTLWDL